MKHLKLVNLIKQFDEQLASIQEGHQVFHCRDLSKRYLLLFIENKFQWLCGDCTVEDYKTVDRESFKLLETFDSLALFWADFTANKNWFKEYDLCGKHLAMIRFFCYGHNQLVSSRELSFSEHKVLYDWIRHCYYSMKLEPWVLHQYCAICRKRMYYSGRYPKTVCSDCTQIGIWDNNGSYLKIVNNNSQLLNIDYLNSYKRPINKEHGIPYKECYIKDVLCKAEPHHFGGVVIQKMDTEYKTTR